MYEQQRASLAVTETEVWVMIRLINLTNNVRSFTDHVWHVSFCLGVPPTLLKLTDDKTQQALRCRWRWLWRICIGRSCRPVNLTERRSFCFVTLCCRSTLLSKCLFAPFNIQPSLSSSLLIHACPTTSCWPFTLLLPSWRSCWSYILTLFNASLTSMAICRYLAEPVFLCLYCSVSGVAGGWSLCMAEWCKQYCWTHLSMA